MAEEFNSAKLVSLLADASTFELGVESLARLSRENMITFLKILPEDMNPSRDRLAQKSLFLALARKYGEKSDETYKVARQVVGAYKRERLASFMSMEMKKIEEDPATSQFYFGCACRA